MIRYNKTYINKEELILTGIINNSKLYQDLIISAGFGKKEDYFQILSQFPEELQSDLIEKTFRIIALENKNESLDIAQQIIGKIKNEKILLECLTFCFQTKELNQDLSQSSITELHQIFSEINPLHRSIINPNSINFENLHNCFQRTINNCEKLFDLIIAYINPNQISQLSPKIQEYTTKKLPQLQIQTIKNTDGNNLEKIEKITNNSDIGLSAKPLIDFLDHKFCLYNNRENNHNQELYIIENYLENEHVLVIKIIAGQAGIELNHKFKIIKTLNEFLVLISDNNYFKSIGLTNFDNLPSIIINHIYPQK